MDDLHDLQASEFVTDTDDQDSLDERIDAEQRLRNQQLWASFQNAACCITKLYRDRAQPNNSPWMPFQHAASNLTTLYRDCIESQRRFARIGYQVGRRRQMREINRLLRKHKQLPSKQVLNTTDDDDHKILSSDSMVEDKGSNLQHNNVASILAVNKIDLDCVETTSDSMQAQDTNQLHLQSQHQQRKRRKLDNGTSNLSVFKI